MTEMTTGMRSATMSESLYDREAKLVHENDELRKLLKEQLKISGKCCYAKAPAYSKIREKLIELGYGPDIITETIGEEL